MDKIQLDSITFQNREEADDKGKQCSAFIYMGIFNFVSEKRKNNQDDDYRIYKT